MLLGAHTNTTLRDAHFASFYKGFGRQIMLSAAHTNTTLGGAHFAAFYKGFVR